MSDHPDRTPRDDATGAADDALARLDELLGELGEKAAEAADSVELDEPAAPAGERPPPAAVPPPGRPAGPDAPAGGTRSFEDRQAEARRLMREELTRRQREIEERRRSFDLERRGRERARAVATRLPALLWHALAAEPGSAREINTVARGLGTLPQVLTATLAAELRREAAEAAAERERRARSAVTSLHTLFTFALAGAPPPPAVLAALGARPLFTFALADAPRPAPIPTVEAELEPTGTPPTPPRPAEPEPEPEPEPVAPSEPEAEAEPVAPSEPEVPEPRPHREPEIPTHPDLLDDERRRWPWALTTLTALAAAALAAGGLWFSGVLAGDSDDGGDGPPSFAVSDGEPTTSVVGQATSPLLDVFAEPEGPEATHTLEHPTETGAPLVFLITDDTTSPERVEVLLPVEPNGSRGWINRSDLSFGVTEFRVIVRPAPHRLELWEGDELVLDVPAAIGSDAPDSGELLYVKELLQPPNADTVYGTYAFGLSGASNTLDKFTEGDGVVAIHGTNDPSEVGKDVERGSIRLTNTDIEELVGVLPLGTPVEIR